MPLLPSTSLIEHSVVIWLSSILIRPLPDGCVYYIHLFANYLARHFKSRNMFPPGRQCLFFSGVVGAVSRNRIPSYVQMYIRQCRDINDDPLVSFTWAVSLFPPPFFCLLGFILSPPLLLHTHTHTDEWWWSKLFILIVSASFMYYSLRARRCCDARHFLPFVCGCFSSRGAHVECAACTFALIVQYWSIYLHKSKKKENRWKADVSLGRATSAHEWKKKKFSHQSRGMFPCNNLWRHPFYHHHHDTSR